MSSVDDAMVIILSAKEYYENKVIRKDGTSMNDT